MDRCVDKSDQLPIPCPQSFVGLRYGRPLSAAVGGNGKELWPLAMAMIVLVLCVLAVGFWGDISIRGTAAAIPRPVVVDQVVPQRNAEATDGKGPGQEGFYESRHTRTRSSNVFGWDTREEQEHFVLAISIIYTMRRQRALWCRCFARLLVYCP